MPDHRKITSSMRPALDNMYEIAALCAEAGMRHVITSPGSRSAPLSLAFARQKDIETHTVPHEGSAAFQALGLAMSTGKVVGLVCTSGTAGLHYAPALAEAREQEVPLLVFTADRPPEWIDQQDGQTIPQNHMYGPLVKRSYVFPDLVATEKAIASDQQWHARRLISEAMSMCCLPPAGPVHVNVPLRPPLYEAQSDSPRQLVVQRHLSYERVLGAKGWSEIQEILDTYPKILLIGAQYALDRNVTRRMDDFCTHHHIPALGDILSNLHELPHLHRHMDLYLDESQEELRADVLISFGGILLSKAVKSFFRSYPPRFHLRLWPQDRPPADPLQSITHHVPLSASHFFLHAHTHIAPRHKKARLRYRSLWEKIEQKTTQQLHHSLENSSFGQFKAMKMILGVLPHHAYLHLGNSMPIRYAQYLGLGPRQDAIEVFANRGTCGIDGCLSTAVGVCKSSTYVPNVLLIGDISFLHDQGALMSSPLPSNLRIVLFNDHGGGIFRLLPAREQPECESSFVSPQHYSIKALALAYGLSHAQANTQDQLSVELPRFLRPSPRAQLLEIETDPKVDQVVFEQLISSL